MVDPLKKIHLPEGKLGPLPKKAWLGIGVVGVSGLLYYRHRQSMADVAQTGDATTAGATTDANGSLVNTDGTDAGYNTNDFAYSPQTDYGLGSDALLGTGGIIAALPVGQSGTDTGSGIVEAATAVNPAAPGAAATAPLAVASPSTAPVVNISYVTAPTPAEKATHIAAVVTNTAKVQQNVKPKAPAKKVATKTPVKKTEQAAKAERGKVVKKQVGMSKNEKNVKTYG